MSCFFSLTAEQRSALTLAPDRIHPHFSWTNTDKINSKYMISKHFVYKAKKQQQKKIHKNKKTQRLQSCYVLAHNFKKHA